ncbi:CD164 sialomucin-like 2 [Labeo rohita]|uniref:CD164 sialomucin-like 2 n=1 Tax=Labeo rohita TaxID=84645 RepID=A0A498MWI3_LABRO|nr:CD164 sialomucin-like 2 [Labeo rohita]
MSDTDDYGGCSVYNETGMCQNSGSTDGGGKDTGSGPNFSQASFDLSSFIGGIILVLVLQAGAFFAMRFLKTKDSSYETINPVMFASNGPGCHSHLYNSIRSYLHNPNRAQPIIGLSSITEVLTYNQPALYFCDVCVLRITKADIRNHIMGSIHRYNYIKSHHAHGWTSDTDLTLLARPLMDIAKNVEKKEGTGDIQVLSVDEVIYKEMTSLPVPDEEAQSDTLAEDTFKFSQSPIAQSALTQTPSDQFQSMEDFLENYNGQKPLIGPSQILKRPADSVLPPSDAWPFVAPDGAPTHQMSKKMKKGHPNKAICTNKLKEPVFKEGRAETSRAVNQTQEAATRELEQNHQKEEVVKQYCFQIQETKLKHRKIRMKFENQLQQFMDQHKSLSTVFTLQRLPAEIQSAEYTTEQLLKAERQKLEQLTKLPEGLSHTQNAEMHMDACEKAP